MKTAQIGSGKVAIGNAPHYSSAFLDGPNNPIMNYSFSAPESVAPAGWGQQGFAFDMGSSPSSQAGVSAFPALSPQGETASGFDLTVNCSYDASVTNEYPNNAALQAPGTATWQVLPSGLGEMYTGVCQNPGIRFWVGHATDGIVLGLGALLGVLVARRDEKKSSDRSSYRIEAQDISVSKQRQHILIKTGLLILVLFRMIRSRHEQ